MNRWGAVKCVVFAAWVAGVLAGCTDVGDNTDLPTPDAAADDTGSGIDVAQDATSPNEGGQDATLESSSVETGVEDTSAGDSSVEDGTLAESSAEDTSVADTFVEDTFVEDTAVEDTGHLDAGVEDAGMQDSTVADAGADGPETDSAVADATEHDSPADSPGDAPSDAPAVDSGGPLAPCTAKQPTGCVECQGNSFPPSPTTLCTPTEAALVQHDIQRGLATAAGPDPAGSCYSCLEQAGCLDDHEFADKGHECEDFAGATGQAQCESVLQCILGSSCASSAVSICYCGTAGVSTACQGDPAPGPINGACATAIAAGLGFPVTDGTDNTKNLTDTTKAAGVADQIFQCAQSNGCSACLQ
jgi:hypothetical protein